MPLLQLGLRHRRQLAVLGSLILATALCLALVVARWAWTHQATHHWLLWNLFLAWLPAAAALAAYNLRSRRGPIAGTAFVLCAVVWLGFWPNAPYLVTDLIHLQPSAGAPDWYDLLMYVTFAWTGFFLGLVSLYVMQVAVARRNGALAGWTVSLGALALGGFGIYLGRFLRWNSWDVLTRPGALLSDIANRLFHPLADPKATVFSLLASLWLGAMYLVLVAVSRLRADDAGVDPQRPPGQ